MRQQTVRHALEENIFIFGRDLLSPRINHLRTTQSPQSLRKGSLTKI